MSGVIFTQASGPLIPSPAKPASSPVAKSNGNASVSDTNIAELDVPKFVSPRLRLDPLLDTVILEFRDDQSGSVLQTVPTQAQLKLYALTNGVHKPGEPAASTVAPAKIAKHSSRY
jgi:hypothetical protein